MDQDLHQSAVDDLSVIRGILEKEQPSWLDLKKPFLMAAGLSLGCYLLYVGLTFLSWFFSSIDAFVYGTYSLTVNTTQVALQSGIVAVVFILYAFRARNRISRRNVRLLYLWGLGFALLVLIQLAYQLRSNSISSFYSEPTTKNPVYGFQQGVLPYLALLAVITLLYAATYQLFPKRTLLVLIAANAMLCLLALVSLPTLSILIVNPKRQFFLLLLYTMAIGFAFLLPALNLLAMGLLVRREGRRG